MPEPGLQPDEANVAAAAPVSTNGLSTSYQPSPLVGAPRVGTGTPYPSAHDPVGYSSGISGFQNNTASSGIFPTVPLF